MSISSYASSSSRSDSGSRYNPLSVEMPGDPATDARLRALEMQLRTANRCSCATQALLGAILVVALLALGGGGGGQGGAALSAPGANVTPAGAPHPGGAGIAGGAKPVEEETEGMLSFGEAFFPMYTSNSSAPERVLLLIPEAELQQPFLVSAMRQRAQGFSHSTTMHYPLEQAVFEWARAPGSSGGGGGAGGGQTDGVWTGWLTSLPVLAHDRTTDDGSGASASTHLLDVTALLTKGQWLTSVMPSAAKLLKHATAAPRIVSARAHPSNLEFVVEWMSVDATGPVAVSVHLSVIQLPKSPLIGRVSDDRIGYFETSYVELGLNDETGEWNAFVKLCNRWRLQKRDPKCTTGCVPARPITYYVDPSVPRRWWGAAAAAVHNWAGAFERAGWKDAIRAVRPDDADWPSDYSAADRRFASISWGPLLSHSGALAIGPHVTDPRTGETLDADIVIDSGWMNIYLNRDALTARPLDGSAPSPIESPQLLRAALLAGGTISFGDAIPQQFIEQALTSVLMHEVGHTLGLRHNFRGSSYFTMQELRNASYLNSTQLHGTANGALSASIMDYVPLNVHAEPVASATGGIFYSLNPGKYDHLAIEYGYKHLADEVSGVKHTALTELAQSLARPNSTWHDRPLVFATDEDGAGTVDPYLDTYDQSAEPIDYFNDTLQLWRRMQPRLLNRTTAADQTFFEFAALVRTGLAKVSTAGIKLAKYIGGRVQRHAHHGDGIQPVGTVPMAKQLRAYALILQTLLDTSFLPDPAVAHFLAQPVGFGGSSILDGCTYGLDSYCLGSAAVDLLTELAKRRELILSSVFTKERLGRVEENRWALNALDGGTSWGAGAFCDVLSLELWPELADSINSTHLSALHLGSAASVASVGKWINHTVGLRAQMPPNYWARHDLARETVHEQLLRRQLQAAWVSLLLDLRGDGTTLAQAAVLTSVEYLQQGLVALLRNPSALPPETIAFYTALDKKISQTSTVNRQRNDLLEAQLEQLQRIAN